MTVDLHKIGNYWSVFEIVSVLIQNDKGKELGLKLFKRRLGGSIPQ